MRGPFKSSVCTESCEGGVGTLTVVLSAPPPGEAFPCRHHRTNASAALPLAYWVSCRPCFDLRAPTSPCLGSVSVRLWARGEHTTPLEPVPEVLADSTRTFLAYQRLRWRKSVNNAGCSGLKPGHLFCFRVVTAALGCLLGYAVGEWCPRPGFASAWFLSGMRRGLL